MAKTSILVHRLVIIVCNKTKGTDFIFQCIPKDSMTTVRDGNSRRDKIVKGFIGLSLVKKTK